MRLGVLLLIVSATLANICRASETDEVKIHGINVDDRQIQIQVTSNGCTNNSSLDLKFSAGELTIIRVKPDKCRRMPHKVWLSFELPPLRTQFTLTNKLSL